MTLSAIVLAKNEERNIYDCLQSIRFVDEVIVVNDDSIDQTAAIATAWGAKIFHRSMAGDYAAQYNFALSQASEDWILIVDADERVTEELRQEVLGAVERNEQMGYEISHLNYVMGQPLKHGGWYSNGGLRLFPRGTVHLEGHVHSKMVHNLSLKKLSGYYIHYPYPTWEKYFMKFNNYTALAAKDYERKGKKLSFLNDIILRPWIAFFKMYIVKAGWRDGKIGFVLAVYHYFYTMTKYVRYYYRHAEQTDRGGLHHPRHKGE